MTKKTPTPESARLQDTEPVLRERRQRVMGEVVLDHYPNGMTPDFGFTMRDREVWGDRLEEVFSTSPVPLP